MLELQLPWCFRIRRRSCRRLVLHSLELHRIRRRIRRKLVLHSLELHRIRRRS